MPGADQGGYAGFTDEVNNHYLRTFGTAALMSLISAGQMVGQMATFGGGGALRTLRLLPAEPVGDGESRWPGPLPRDSSALWVSR